jgi:hypothetical protein
MIARAAPRLLAIAALALVLGACVGALPVPKTGPHVGEDPVAVPDEEPPGKVEVVPSPPAKLKHPVWVEGEWLWKGHRWAWKDGGWQDAPAGMYYAPPKTVRVADGTLVHFAGLWKPVEPTPPKK